MHVLENIRDMLYDEIECIAEKGQIANGSTLEVIDKLTHSLKSIETILAMENYEEDDYSRRGGRGRYSYGNNMRNGRMMDNNGGQYNYSSYRGGRTSRGRYSREDGKEKIIEKLEDYMEMTGSEKTRDAIKKVIEQVQSED